MSDVVVGVRNIKCYGWENQYLKKLDKIRSAQSPNVFKMNFLATYGTSMFQISGTCAIFFILLYWWGRGEQLNLIRLYSLFGGVFVLFIAVN